MLSIKDLCQRANISQQTFYRLARDNNEFSAVIETNRVKKGNGFRYNEAVLEWLCAYYDRETEPEAPSEASETPLEHDELQQQIKALTEQNEALESEITSLKAKLLDAEQERKLLIGQNAQLTLLLGQEKMEKQALLPAPRKPFIERVKGFFAKPEQTEKQPEN